MSSARRTMSLMCAIEEIIENGKGTGWTHKVVFLDD